MAHTPGPWKVRKHWSDEGAYEVFPTRGKKPTWGEWSAIAEVTDAVSKGESAKANARLIAAAPDLLEALQSVWLWMESQADAQSKGGHATFDLMALREQRDIARAAIAKATGEQ